MKKEIKELQKKIDTITNECINTIKNEIGVNDFSIIDYDNLEDYDTEFLERIEQDDFKQAEKVFNDFCTERKKLLYELLELTLQDEEREINDDDYDMIVEEYNLDFVYKFYENCAISQ